MTIKDIDRDRLLNVIKSLGWTLKKAQYSDTTTELTISKEYEGKDTTEDGKDKQYTCTPI